MGYARRWVTEDAFINLRVVRACPRGPRARVQRRRAGRGVHQPALDRAAHGLGSRARAARDRARWRSGSSSRPQASCWPRRAHGGSAAASWRRRTIPRLSGSRCLAFPLGAAIFAAIPVVWDFTTSGLECGLTTAWLGGTFWLIARAQPIAARDARVAAFAIGCGPLIRPDLALFSIGFGIALIIAVRDDADRGMTAWEWARLAIIAAALPLGYQVFRMGYFAALVPNTAIAKEAAASYWPQGWRYTLDFVGTYALWLPLAGAAVWAATLLRPALRSGGANRRAPAGSDAVRPRPLVVRHAGRAATSCTAASSCRPCSASCSRSPPSSFPLGGLRSWRAAVLLGVGAWAVVCAVSSARVLSRTWVCPGPGASRTSGAFTPTT